MVYKCRGCKESKQRKEFYYKNFENTLPRKLCLECEKKEAITTEVEVVKATMEDEIDNLHEVISKMAKKIKILESQNNISVAVNSDKIDLKIKHKNLNVYMEPDNKEGAWFKYKGNYRMYRTYPNKFVDGDVCIVVQRPYGGKKYYGLQKMYEWIMEQPIPTYSSQDKEEVEAPF